MSNSVNQHSALSSALKDEILLISALIVLVGVASTEAYYRTFGIHYQFLGLSPTHILNNEAWIFRNHGCMCWMAPRR